MQTIIGLNKTWLWKTYVPVLKGKWSYFFSQNIKVCFLFVFKHNNLTNPNFGPHFGFDFLIEWPHVELTFLAT
jgi:hypothetical protein